jgi:hypothetical protein
MLLNGTSQADRTEDLHKPWSKMSLNDGWKTVGGNLAAGNANAFAFAWQNPESYAITVKAVTIVVATPGGTSGSVMDVGAVANATSTSNGIFNDINLNAAATSIYLAVESGDVAIAEAGGATDYITGKILTQNAASLVGTYKISYVRA